MTRNICHQVERTRLEEVDHKENFRWFDLAPEEQNGWVSEGISGSRTYALGLGHWGKLGKSKAFWPSIWLTHHRARQDFMGPKSLSQNIIRHLVETFKKKSDRKPLKPRRPDFEQSAAVNQVEHPAQSRFALHWVLIEQLERHCWGFYVFERAIPSVPKFLAKFTEIDGDFAMNANQLFHQQKLCVLSFGCPRLDKTFGGGLRCGITEGKCPTLFIILVSFKSKSLVKVRLARLNSCCNFWCAYNYHRISEDWTALLFILILRVPFHIEDCNSLQPLFSALEMSAPSLTEFFSKM